MSKEEDRIVVQIARVELARLAHPHKVLICNEGGYSLSSNDVAAAVWVPSSDDATESIASARGKALVREDRLLPLLEGMDEAEIRETMGETWQGWQEGATVSEMIGVIKARRDLLNPSPSEFSALKVTLAADVRKGKVSRVQPTQTFSGIPAAPRLPLNQEKAARVVLLAILKDQKFHGAVELHFERQGGEDSFYLVSAKVCLYHPGGIIRLA